ncbi:nuclear transport factor 2 family protein [Streptomyces sp. CBMA123]|uniref:nuclear transport factor 2 family protein n=1 Tax=Streptomyces sp. CBMA123 TaxID=1896313 RepID=UPI001661CB32|nr:nuclear transport factor 2 family protein [Streptomyces sp. CBMA123]MBD0692939.1 hypothetical protein [Streptomyces sp. CBMA123]
MDFSAIANAFVNHYFTTFDDYSARGNLASLYRPESMLTWEGAQIQGASGIIGQLAKPELKTVRTQITSVDPQPCANGSVVVLVTGSLAVDNAYDKPLRFSEMFVLAPIPDRPGGFFVYNQVFRLILG